MEKEPLMNNGDIESGNSNLVEENGDKDADMAEDGRLRRAMASKVVVILIYQQVFNKGRPIPDSLQDVWGTWETIGTMALLPLLVWPRLSFRKDHPLNIIMLLSFIVFASWAVGFQCAVTKGAIILLATILSTGALIILTFYSFWATKRGYNSDWLSGWLCHSLSMLSIYICLQILFSLGRVHLTIYGHLAALLFLGFIIFDMDNLIRRRKYYGNTGAVVALFLDVFSLFLSMMAMSPESKFFNAVF